MYMKLNSNNIFCFKLRINFYIHLNILIDKDEPSACKNTSDTRGHSPTYSKNI